MLFDVWWKSERYLVVLSQHLVQPTIKVLLSFLFKTEVTRHAVLRLHKQSPLELQ